jgi:hypothetical protein
MMTASAFPAQSGWFEDFERGESPFGAELLERGGSLGKTVDVDTVRDESGFLGSTSAYLSEAWDLVSWDLGITEGLVSVWFYDTGYEGPNANSIRLRTTEDGDLAGWPKDSVTVELRGKSTGHGGGILNVYYINRPAPDLNAMGTYFGSDIATGERTPRRREAWNEATFHMDGGKTYTSVNGSFSDCIVESPMTKLDLLCRSGWYMTRGGDPKIMLWDDLCVMPKIRATDWSTIPHWIETDSRASIIDSVSPSLDFVFLPDTEKVVRLAAPDTAIRADWDVDQGMIETWFWDTNDGESGYKTEIGVRNRENPTEYLVVKAYSVVMNNVAEVYYASTHLTGHGGSFSAPRSKGWHKITFRKVQNELRVAIDGHMADGDTLVWTDPPSSLEFFMQSGTSDYYNGSCLWLSRMMFAGDAAVPVSGWMLY